jgi:hypothetical protein
MLLESRFKLKPVKDTIKSEESPFKISFTDHFIERAHERGLSTNQAIKFFKALLNPENRQKLKDIFNKNNDVLVKKDSINIPIIRKGSNKLTVKTFFSNKEYEHRPGQEELTLSEKIEKVGNEWVVYSKKGGKRLGTHPTKDAALKQLAAIEISKQKQKQVKEIFYKVMEDMPKEKKLNILESIIKYL